MALTGVAGVPRMETWSRLEVRSQIAMMDVSKESECMRNYIILIYVVNCACGFNAGLQQYYGECVDPYRPPILAYDNGK